MKWSPLMPWRRHTLAHAPQQDAPGSTAQTAIIDWNSTQIQEVTTNVRACDVSDQRSFIQQAHRLIAANVMPVYALNDRQKASQTVRLGRGSCSQRMAVLEAVARSQGIETRVRGLLIDGKFWYPRFPLLKFAVPREVVLAWPEFKVDGKWTSISELFGNVNDLAQSGLRFTNSRAETLFDAVANTAVDWDGTTAVSCPSSGCDLSGHVVQDCGLFSSRDEVFDSLGPTVCGPALFLLNPLLSRWSPAS